MFVVLLRFSTKRSQASEWMTAHQDWLQRGFDDGVFVASGSLGAQQGGAILAHGSDAAALRRRVADDPFVAHDIVSADIIEVALSRVIPQLQFLAGSASQ